MVRFMRAASLLAALFLSGCAGTFTHNVAFNPSEPIRVAVLPFYQVNDKGEIVEPDASLLIDSVSLVSNKLKETPAKFTRKLVRAELQKTSLDLVNANLVDSELVHHGFAKEDFSFDIEKILATPPAEFCNHLVYCDAVLYGKITDWDRSYYGIQSTSSVGIELKLVSARDGKVLFESKGQDSDSRGLSKGPTGFSDLVIEPIKGLDNEILVDLAQSTVRKMLDPLIVTKRPEFLASSPPSIYASAHDAREGIIERGGHLTVLMVGSPKKEASFSISNVIENVPMTELESGHYVGEYYPVAVDSFVSAPVIVQLKDQYGRVTKQKLGRTNVTLK